MKNAKSILAIMALAFTSANMFGLSWSGEEKQSAVPIRIINLTDSRVGVSKEHEEEALARAGKGHAEWRTHDQFRGYTGQREIDAEQEIDLGPIQEGIIIEIVPWPTATSRALENVVSVKPSQSRYIFPVSSLRYTVSAQDMQQSQPLILVVAEDKTGQFYLAKIADRARAKIDCYRLIAR